MLVFNKKMERFFLTIEYDGGAFCGWQKQKNNTVINNKISVQNFLSDAAKNLTGEDITFHGAGRTDAGVHARGQVAHIDVETLLIKKYPSFVQGMNFYLKHLPISVLSMSQVSTETHARFSAVQRSYRYIILNRHSPPAIELQRVWWIHKYMDIKKMQEAVHLFLGTHDFNNFRDAQCQSKTSIKTIDSIAINKHDNIINLDISAKSFLHRQVRMITGAIVNVGIGRWDLDMINNLLQLKCSKIAFSAPAHGLYFQCVKYNCRS